MTGGLIAAGVLLLIGGVSSYWQLVKLGRTLEVRSFVADDALRVDMEVATLDDLFYAPDSEGNAYAPGA